MSLRTLKIGFALLIFPSILFAHNINYALSDAPTHDVVWFYMKLGIQHIIPEGVDHILFIVALCLLSTRIKTILWQATAFTVAHSITLALSMKNIIVAPGAVMEPIISLSIVFVAVENILMTRLRAWRILVVFFFGLVHGLGFASTLNEIGLPPGKFLISVLSFNGGVEIGQVTVILATFLFLIVPFGKNRWYRHYIVIPISIIIALIAIYWTVIRVFQ
jgi:hypothetical protein